MSLTCIRRLVGVAMLLLPGVAYAQRAAPRTERAAPERATHDAACAAWTRALDEQGAVALRRWSARRHSGCFPSDSVIGRLWRSVSADTAQLSLLVELTSSLGGVRPLRGAVRTLRDRRRPVLVRVAAIAAISAYIEPRDACALRLLDTLAGGLGCWVDHPSYRASSSVEPLIKDSLRAALRVAARERGALGRAASSLLLDWRVPERWSDARAAWCRRSAAAFAPALRMNPATLASEELRQLSECTESGPPALSLAWQAAPPDTTLLVELIRMSAPVRDRRLYGALLAVARDPSRPVLVRVAAVDAVAPLLHPALYWFQTERAGSGGRGPCSAWGMFAHEAEQEEGAEPMGPASRRAGVTELLRLAGENVPPQVREAARTVARCAANLLESRPPQAS